MLNKLFACVVALLIAASTQALNPKREFRGAWIQCVNNQFNGMGRDRMQADLTHQLDELQRSGINAIMFQVRPEGDALYQSAYEPWSRFLTGQQGRAPEPYWDPLAWMIDECHRRGMELHAWINPFRAKTKGTPALTSPYRQQHPERFFQYDGLELFDPAYQENRDYICFIATDIVRRYDVDGLHIDDYFYPYPVAGVQIPDGQSYQRWGAGMSLADWRRSNVNRFIEQLSTAIHQTKPWVKFSVSPFGIYRNIPGKTNGLQNYDDLYADVLLWVNQGWIDLNIPQVYWEIGNKAADYQTLLLWWNNNAGARPLVIGQDIDRTLKHGQTHQKYDLQRAMPYVQGSCQWYARAAVDNQDYANTLRTRYHSTPALQPEMKWLDAKAPRRVRRVRKLWTQEGYTLLWKAPRGGKNELQRAQTYVVYCFRRGESIDLEDPSHIVALTSNTFVRLPYADGQERYTYVVTALDRVSNESKAKRKRVKL